MQKLVFPILFAAVFIGLACSGCKDHNHESEVGAINVVFKATYKDQPFVANKKYDYVAGKQVFFNLFQYFISDVELLKADGTTHKLTDIDYVNLSFNSETEATSGKKFTFENVPHGEYTGIRLGIGVSPDLNSQNPNQLPDTSPLTVNGRGEFWVGWASYIFMKIEGKYDADGDGANFENPLLYHCGSDAVYRTITLLDSDLHVGAGHVSSLNLTTDIAKLLRENGQPLDLVGSPATSDDPSNVVVATKLMDNLPEAVKIQ